jgi:hypothetical protein
MKHTAFSIMSEMNKIKITVASNLWSMRQISLPVFLERAKHYLNKPNQ